MQIADTMDFSMNLKKTVKKAKSKQKKNKKRKIKKQLLLLLLLLFVCTGIGLKSFSILSNTFGSYNELMCLLLLFACIHF